MDWTNKEERLLRKYYPRSNWKEILKHLPRRTRLIITFKARDSGIRRISRAHHDSWSDNEDRLLTKIYLNNTAIDTAKKILNRTASAVQERIKKLKLKHSRDYLESPNSTGDLRPLLKETNKAYYWIGFLCADGCFSSGFTNLLLAKKDKSHIYKYSKFIKSRIKKLIGANKKTYYYTSCVHKINTNRIKKKFGFSSRKTYIPPYYKISKKDKLFMSYMIGYIDGDGHVAWCSKKYKYLISIGCHKSWKSWIQKTFSRVFKILNIKVHICISNNTPPTCIAVSMASKDFLLKLKAYAKNLKIPYLCRKIGAIGH